MASAAVDEESDENQRVDFITEFHMKNYQYVIDKVLEHLSPITILRASTVSQSWCYILKDSKKYPHEFAQLFDKYFARNPALSNEELLGGQHLEHYEVVNHKMYPGGDVKTILVEKEQLYVGLASGLTKQWDLSNYDNLKYPATKYFDPDNGKGVTHLDINDKYLATGHGNVVLIWSLDSAAILSEAIALDSQFDFIGSMALSQNKRIAMITRFNGFLRVWDDVFVSRSEEYKLDALPKTASLSSEAFVYSYQYQDDCPWFWNYKLCIIKVQNHGIEKHIIDMKREIGWIFQDYPILFLEMSYMGNKELQMWDLTTLSVLYAIEIDDFHLRYLGMKNWIYWCHIGQGKGQLTYGSLVDLMDKKFHNKKPIEDDTDEELYLSYLSGHTLVFSKPGGIEMKVFGLKYKDESYAQLL